MEDPKYRSGVKDEKKGETKEGATQSDELLKKLGGVIESIENSSQCQTALTYELGNLQESQRQAPVLRYIAAMLKHELKTLTERGMMVVAVALLKLDGKWRFIVAVNGNKKLRNYRKKLLRAIPTAIGGIPVDSLMDDEYWRLPDEVVSKAITLDSELTGRMSRRGGNKDYEMVLNRSKTGESSSFAIVRRPVPKLKVKSVWQWHSEQKLLRYVKVAYGQEVRESIVALGISKSPCTGDDEGANHCDEYLYRKYLRTFCGDKQTSVAAYWYKEDGHGNTLSPTCSKESLRARGVEVKDAG